MSARIKTHANEIAIFLLVLVCYAYFLPRWADQSQNSRLNMVVAVVDDGTLRIDKYVSNTTDYAKVGNHYYSDKAPGAAFLGIPIYAALDAALNLPVLDQLTERLANSDAFRTTLRADGSGVYGEKVRFALALVVLSFLLGAVPSAVLCVLVYRMSLSTSGNAKVGVTVALAYGLLTPAFAYANAFYGHQLVAAMTFGAFHLAFGIHPHQSRQSQTNGLSGHAPTQIVPTWKLVLIGVLLGYSVVTEYPTLLITAIVLAYAAFRLWRVNEVKRVAWLLPGLVVCASVLMVYNTALFGGPFKLGYNNSELWAKQHSTGFLSLTLPNGDALWGITFSLFRGLFILSPILLLAAVGFVAWWRSKTYRAEFWVSLLSTAAFLGFNSSSVMWWGGFSIGPRYLLPALPFAALALAFAFAPLFAPEPSGARRVRARGYRWLCAVLAAWSLVATWGMTLAEQAFPPDTLFNPLVDYALPNWLAGNIARNLGTLLGFKGLAGLLPLAALVGLIFAGWWVWTRRRWVENADADAYEMKPVRVSGET